MISINMIQSSGQSGIDFAREALKHNHSLTLYVRSPGKLPQDIKDNAKVTIVQGGFDADLETIRPAVTNGAEAIVSTAGPIPTNNGNGTVSFSPLRRSQPFVQLNFVAWPQADSIISPSQTSTRSSASLPSRSPAARSGGH